MLIKPGSQWPPPGYAALRQRWLSLRAWWSGNTRYLAAHVPAVVPNGYWDKRRKHPEDRAAHSALARDIARTSADLVCGDTPAIKWGDDTDPAAKAMQAAWDEYTQVSGWGSTLLEAAETASALGGVFLRPAWDANVVDRAIMQAVPCDEALPEFRWGILWRIAFVQELPAPDGWTTRGKTEVWRHIEHHEPGLIRNELWLGTLTHIGDPRPLADHPTTATMPAEVDTTAIRPTGILVEHWPNLLPDPDPDSGLPIGVSDLAGLEPLMDMLDEAYSSWMRDIHLGKMRILAAQEMMDSAPSTGGVLASVRGKLGMGGKTAAKVFDEDREVFTPVPGMPMDDQGRLAPITPVEFKIRFEEHRTTCEEWIKAIVSRAGFAPQTFGFDVEGQMSGTSRRLVERRSYRTQGKKRRYGRPPIERSSETLALINHVVFKGPKPPQRPTLEWVESDRDMKELAEIIELLRRAESASDEVVVEMLHPDWDGDQVKEEVDRLGKAREAATAPAPFGDESTPPADRPPAAEDE